MGGSIQQFCEEVSMRNQHILMGLVAWTLCTGALAANPVADRLAAQNALFDEQYESDLKALVGHVRVLGCSPWRTRTKKRLR